MRRILIANDDGVESPGILALAEAAREFGEVLVVAPHRERSTSGHSLTLHKPLRFWQVSPGRYATTGTPADCIYLGMREIGKDKLPDVILSGINQGANLGTDVHYSGTVAAAREGALMNIKSFAFSLVYFPGEEVSKADFDRAGKSVRRVLAACLDLEFPKHTLINVNIPHLKEGEPKGITLARQGFRYYSNEVERRIDPRGKEYYWIGGSYKGFEKSADSDCHAVNEGFVSVTPLTIDCTHQFFYDKLNSGLSFPT